MTKGKILLGLLTLLTSVWVAVHNPETAKEPPNWLTINLSLITQFRDKDEKEERNEEDEEDEKATKK